MSASAEPEQRATGAGKRIIFQSEGLKSYAEIIPLLWFEGKAEAANF